MYLQICASNLICSGIVVLLCFHSPICVVVFASKICIPAGSPPVPILGSSVPAGGGAGLRRHVPDGCRAGVAHAGEAAIQHPAQDLLFSDVGGVVAVRRKPPFVLDRCAAGGLDQLLGLRGVELEPLRAGGAAGQDPFFATVQGEGQVRQEDRTARGGTATLCAN